MIKLKKWFDLKEGAIFFDGKGMGRDPNNRFEDFFNDSKYFYLKNYLYNYLLRKKAVQRNVGHPIKSDLILEIGSGISPVTQFSDRVIYSDLSYTAMRYLRQQSKSGFYAVADGSNLPFKENLFSHVICSEVLEHIKKDADAMQEMARVMKKGGNLVITFPHRKAYFAIDDKFVNHYRRYELPEMISILKAAGLTPQYIEKVLGPIEKITMYGVVKIFSFIQNRLDRKATSWVNGSFVSKAINFIFKWLNTTYMILAWTDAKIMPRSLAAVLLIRAKK
jgi:ubiquinone/menaquinone biosynthesis C-methylase UbiE